MKIPSREDRAAALAAAPSHRFPEKATIKVRGDRGVFVELPCVLGNPSGASMLLQGEKTSPAWNTTVAIILGLSKTDPNTQAFNDQFAFDCLLWPSREVIGEWTARWPAIGAQISEAVLKKIGYVGDCVQEPDGDPPDAIAKVLAAHPAAAWRTVKARSHRVAMVIDPPKEMPWRLFVDAAKKPGADVWKLVKEMLAACVVHAEPLSIESIVGQYAGAAFMLMLFLNTLAGASAEVELGE